MTLRKRLSWLFLLLLLLVLLAVNVLGERLLLPYLDQQDQLRLHQASGQVQHALEQQGRYLLSRLDGYALRLASATEDVPAAPAELDFILRLDDGEPALSLFSRLEMDLAQLALDAPLAAAEPPTISWPGGRNSR